MKKLVLMLIAVLAAGCATQQEKAAQMAEKAAVVKKSIDSHRYVVEVRTMHPMRGGSVQVTSDFTLQMKGDTLVSYLPYFGRAYNVPYTGGKGLNFTALVEDYTQLRNDKKELTQVSFVCRNDEDHYRYVLNIYDNGEVDINLTSRNRERISYNGVMDL